MDRRAFVGAVAAGIMAAPLAEFRPLGAPRSILRRQRRSYFQIALRQFIANQIPSPARSAASRRRLGFCHAKVTQRHLASSAFRAPRAIQ
jgi:hypothetical protein